VINTNLPPILHRFRDIAVDKSEIAIFDIVAEADDIVKILKATLARALNAESMTIRAL